MSNNLKLQVLLKAVDQATRPFKAIQTATKSLSGSIRETQSNIKVLDQQAAKIDGFRKASAQLAVTQRSLKTAKDEAAALAIAFRNTERPTAAQTRALEAAKRAAAELQTKSNSLRLSVQQQREALNAAGISTKSLSSEQQRLRSSSAQATVSLSRQKQELQRLSQQQEKLNHISERYRNGQEMAAKVRNTGAAAVGAATVGGVAGTALLRPGYDFALSNSTLQATLGLDKTSPEFQSLRTQARQIGDNTAASAGDAANAQIIIAKAGGNVDDIKAATPVTLNMSLANNRTMEESAKLLMSTKSAFGMANSEVAHLGDVISSTLNKTAADFDGLSDALTYIAPVAKNAGVSVEQTTAIIGALAKDGITGSMAGTGARAMLSRLQAPTGQAYSAIKELGVKTADTKGNMRPFFTILKEMQRSFDKNKLGTAQRAEYMKTIFGEEASASAATLMRAASNGMLDGLTKTFQGSNGSTEKLVKVQQDNLGGDFKEFQSASEAIGTDLFDDLDSSLRSLTQDTTKFLLKVDSWIQKNPELAGGIAKAATVGLILVGAFGALALAAWPVMLGINALVAGAGLLGTAFTVVSGLITGALGAISFPVIAVVAAVVAGALIIRKYWEPIKAYISGVAEGFTAAMGPISGAFSTLDPLIATITEALKGAFKWFTDLITPIKATDDKLKAVGDRGKWLGEKLAAGLKIPTQAFDYISSKVDWLLDKLGLIDSKSSDMNDKVSKADSLSGAHVNGDMAYTPAAMNMPLYSPVMLPGNTAASQQNTYNSNYVLNMHEGMSKDDALALMAQNSAREKRQGKAQQRSRMGWED